MNMSSYTLFNLTETIQQYMYRVDSQLFLHIESVSDLFAYLYFTDGHDTKIDVPSTIEVSTSTYEYFRNMLPKKTKIVLKSFVSSNLPEINRPPFDAMFYYLDAMERYEITYNDKIILTFTPIHSWEIEEHMELRESIDISASSM